MFAPSRILDVFGHESKEILITLIIFSLIKLIVGAGARLAKLAMVHHVVIRGNNICVCLGL